VPEVVAVYFDYLCPFAWRGAEVAEVVAEELGLEFSWKHFSLYQSNYQGTDGWQLWNDKIDPEDESGGRGLLPFLASCAARRQGVAMHHRFRLAAMRAHHCERRPYTRETIFEVAEIVGLHLPKFEHDLADPECRTALAHEHYRAKTLNVFGTPTFHFSSGHLAYFRVRELPSGRAEALALFQDFRGMLERYPYLETVKRPRPQGN
jgi:predicted DsbA family dithiol-disulfide isomerase